MPRQASRFVLSLTDEEKEFLRYLKDEGENARIRKRAHAILLSDAGHTVNDIADIFEVDRDTVCSWIRRWEEEGVMGLADKPRSGAPPTLDESECDKVLEFLNEHPHSPTQVLRRVQKELGKTISGDTLRRIARRAGFTWKRMRRSLKSQRNEEDFRDAHRDLSELIELHCSGKLDLCYFDEAGFSLTPSVPYGWQPIGETIEIPSQRSKQVNVLGFLRYNGTCRPYAVDGKITSNIVVECFDDFCKTIERDTIVAIDNASVHSSAEFTANIPRWQEHGLYVYFLPAYCPELNLIEILWRMIKYRWLPLSAYDNIKSLIRSLANVFSRIGKDLFLEFNPPAVSTP